MFKFMIAICLALGSFANAASEPVCDTSGKTVEFQWFSNLITSRKAVEKALIFDNISFVKCTFQKWPALIIQDRVLVYKTKNQFFGDSTESMDCLSVNQPELGSASHVEAAKSNLNQFIEDARYYATRECEKVFTKCRFSDQDNYVVSKLVSSGPVPIEGMVFQYQQNVCYVRAAVYGTNPK